MLIHKSPSFRMIHSLRLCDGPILAEMNKKARETPRLLSKLCNLATLNLWDLALLRPQAVIHLKQLVPSGPVDYPPAARVGRLAEQQFSAPIAVGVHRVDQLKLGRDVEVKLVCNSGIEFSQIAVNIRIGHQHDRVLQIGSHLRMRRSCRRWGNV